MGQEMRLRRRLFAIIKKQFIGKHRHGKRARLLFQSILLGGRKKSFCDYLIKQFEVFSDKFSHARLLL